MNLIKESPTLEITIAASASHFPNSTVQNSLNETPGNTSTNAQKATRITDIVCVSHLRWDFVYQRPQHLLSRFAKEGRVLFLEEPIFIGDDEAPYLEVSEREGGKLTLAVPHIPGGHFEAEVYSMQAELLEEILAQKGFENYLLWMYTPMGLNVVGNLNPAVTVFDCMDELSAFKGADSRLVEMESQLMKKADLVFTGGQSLYEAKRNKHDRAYAFPSSIDKEHFGKAKQNLSDAEDQASIPYPRVGFFGVVDERFDIDLLATVARLMKDIQFVIIGPVVKIDPATLPRRENIHYLGGKTYNELPIYLSNWDMAMLPFAMNESTRFISPTKTPEYLAAGKQVVSTPIKDVVNPYGEKGLVEIALSPFAFAEAIRRGLANKQDAEWRQNVDTFLSTISWDKTFQDMKNLIHEVHQIKSN